MNANPSRAPGPAEDDCALLSALVDGDADALHSACDRWARDAESRQTWYAYHVIGDVLRSDELAASPARDAAFLAALRERLADEPVVVAPAPVLRRRQPWLLPAAAAAGFVAVAGVMVVFRLGASAGGPVVADATPASQPATMSAGDLRRVNTESVPPSRTELQVQGRMIRDPQLQRMLEAHRSSVGLMGIAVPGGVPRNVDVVATEAQPQAGGR